MGERIKLYTGLYHCPRCGAEYDCIRLRPEDLRCYDCGEELKFVNPVQVWVRRYPYSLHVRNNPRRAKR